MMDHFSRYVVDRDTGCWNWTGSIDYKGYGRVRVNGHARAHRAFYAKFNGDIPDGLQIDHLCRNRRCVNPSHLEAVTQKENILRGTSPSARAAKQSHCVNGHAFNEANIRWVAGRRGNPCRQCRACTAERTRRYRAERAAHV